jgi:hypothetical protein
LSNEYGNSVRWILIVYRNYPQRAKQISCDVLTCRRGRK